MNSPRLLLACSLLLAIAGCQDDIDLDPLDDSPVREASVRPPPILGGTLLLVDQGTAIATDPDRDLVHVVDLDQREVRHTIALQSGDLPHRSAVDGLGRVHVVLRGAGSIATIDPDSGSVIGRHTVCPEPRGIAFHEEESSLYVACAGGSVARLSQAGEVQERWQLEPDLRDVLIVDGDVMVSTFRSANVLGLNGSRLRIPNVDNRVAHVAWRTWVTDSGDIAMLHQLQSKKDVPIDLGESEVSGGGSAYGGGNFCDLGIVSAAFTTISPQGEFQTSTIPESNLSVDAAFASEYDRLALAVPGAPVSKDPDESISTVQVAHREQFSCQPSTHPDVGQVTAVAYDANTFLYAQSREPAQIVKLNGPMDILYTIPLPGESRFDTGHEIFHRATESQLSCASCHPEGTDDGHVWNFETLGPRRTQPLDVGIADTAPYHWDGDMADVDALLSEVLAHRMGGMRQSAARADSFKRWVFELERPAARTGDPVLMADGEALFTSYGCDSCHYGPALGGQKTEPIAGVRKQVPTLRRISLHPPFMHDGRSKTLEAAVRDMIETTRSIDPPQEDVDAIAAYLRSL